MRTTGQQPRLLAINPQFHEEKYLSFPLGLGTIAAIVRRKGLDVRVLDLDAVRRDDVRAALGEIDFEPDIVLLSGMITQYKRIVELAAAARELWPGAVSILGGSLATTAPDNILRTIPSDVFVMGEGDEIIGALLDELSAGGSLERVGGIKYIEEGRLAGTGPAGAPDITLTPRPAYELFPMEEYIRFLKKVNYSFEIYTSKGCPFSCTYCYKISGRKVRRRRIDDIISEIDFIKTTYGMDRFCFVDDCFATDRKWLEEFCREFRKLGVRFRFQAAIKILDEEMLELLKGAGLSGVSMGIESASPAILAEYNKKHDVEKAERLISWMRENDIQYNATFIIGSFGESDETVRMTRDFLLKMGFRDNFQLFFLTPYPGTALYERAVREGYIADEEHYLKNLRLLDEISVNLTGYPDEKLYAWRDGIIREVAGAPGGVDCRRKAVSWKREPSGD